MWQLRGGREAAGAFTGDAPDILQNPLYQARRGDLQQPMTPLGSIMA